MEVILDEILNRLEAKYLVIQAKLDTLRNTKSPTQKDAKSLKNNIPNSDVSWIYFFNDLNNPSWLNPLWEEGFFSTPPKPIENREEGTIFHPQWPLSKYLLTMAPLEPDLVSNIILGIETTNGTIQADLINAVCKLPTSLAAKHAEKISHWEKSPSIFMEHHIGNLVSYLSKGKEITAAAIITKEFLRLRPGNLKGTKETDETPPIHLEPLSRVDSWEYGEFLKNNYPDFLNAAPREALTLVIDVLEETLHMEGYGQTDDFQDYSGRPAIEDHDQNPNFGEPKDLLITSVRDSAVHCVNEDPKSFENILQELDTKRLSIFKRISLYLIRLFGKENIQLVENRILNRDRFYNYWTHYEYVHLIQDYFSTLSRDKQKTILGWIREGPKTINGEEIKSIDKEYWQLQWLTILKDQLPTSWENKRLNFLKKYPEPEHPDLYSWSSEMMSGPTSPLSPEQFKTMSIDDVITFLHSWKAPSGFTMDSPEGISRSLATAISDDPARFATDAKKFIGCDPTYVHGVFDGLRQGLKAEKRFDWRPVIKLMDWVIKQGREIPGRQAGKSWDMDPDWGWTRTEMSRLLESGCNATRNQIPYGLKGSVWKMLLPMTDDPNPTPEEESDTSMDPATNSLNTTRGTAFHALIAYALWIKRNIIKRKGKTDKEINFKSDLPDVLDVLEKHLDPIYDPSPTIRAVYGICFSNLAYLDRKWVVGNKERIFPKNVEI